MPRLEFRHKANCKCNSRQYYREISSKKLAAVQTGMFILKITLVSWGIVHELSLGPKPFTGIYLQHVKGTHPKSCTTSRLSASLTGHIMLGQCNLPATLDLSP